MGIGAGVMESKPGVGCGDWGSRAAGRGAGRGGRLLAWWLWEMGGAGEIFGGGFGEGGCRRAGGGLGRGVLREGGNIAVDVSVGIGGRAAFRLAVSFEVGQDLLQGYPVSDCGAAVGGDKLRVQGILHHGVAELAGLEIGNGVHWTCSHRQSRMGRWGKQSKPPGRKNHRGVYCAKNGVGINCSPRC